MPAKKTPPKKGDKKADKKADNKPEDKKGKKRRASTAVPYIRKIFKSGVSELRISSKSLSSLASATDQMIEDIVVEATKMTKRAKAKTVTERNIKAAIEIVFDRATEVAKKATKFIESRVGKDVTEYPKTSEEGKPMSSADKYKLKVSPAYCARFFDPGYWKSEKATVAVAAAVEKVLEMVHDHVKQVVAKNKSVTVSNRFLELAKTSDGEDGAAATKLLFPGTLAGGGVAPHIESELLKKKKNKNYGSSFSDVLHDIPLYSAYY
tara:strand:+ start:134 stop:928 length:795 start_codon:yes stop_codon:yes gene_type:complete